VLDASNDTVFASGTIDATYEVNGHDTPYEPHYNVIRRPHEVQIYELVMGDVNGDPTTVLERAKDPLKDNRLVPMGFSTTHPSYDTTRIAGLALNDPDFNRNSLNEEGSGTDVIHYHVPVAGIEGALRAVARVYYQPLPPAWNAEMFAFNSARIDTFRTMLNASDGRPILVAADSVGIGPLGVEVEPGDRITIYPNPSSDGRVMLHAAASDRVQLEALFDASGRRLPLVQERSGRTWRIQLPDAPGLYYLQLRVNGTAVLERLMRR
jgi:hypothetical protein